MLDWAARHHNAPTPDTVARNSAAITQRIRRARVIGCMHPWYSRNTDCSVVRRVAATLGGVSARHDAISCCPACAASVRRKRRHVPQRAWIGLLGMVAATLPIAAITDGSATSAQAAAPPAPVPAPAPEAPAPPPPLPIEARVQWRESIAHGTANTGWLERGVILPEEGPGFYTYYPYTQRRGNREERRYGTAKLVREIIDLGKWWTATYPGAPRLGVGDLSFKGGGPFDLHASHENGLDVDIRMPRADGTEGQVGPGSYDRARTQAMVNHLVGRGAEFIFYGPNIKVTGPAGIVMIWPNHDDHLHIRFPDPDGRGN